MQLDPEHADSVAVPDPGVGRICFLTAKSDVQGVRIRALQEPRRVCPNGCPGITLAIHRAQHDERQLRIEGAVLLDQMITQHPAADLFHTSGHTSLTLQRLLTGMPGGCAFGCGGQKHQTLL